MNAHDNFQSMYNNCSVTFAARQSEKKTKNRNTTYMGSSLCFFSCMISKYSLNDVRVSPFPPLRTMSSDVPLSIDQSRYILSRLGFVHFVGSVQSEAPFLNCTIRGFLYLLRKKAVRSHIRSNWLKNIQKYCIVF